MNRNVSRSTRSRIANKVGKQWPFDDIPRSNELIRESFDQFVYLNMKSTIDKNMPDIFVTCIFDPADIHFRNEAKNVLFSKITYSNTIEIFSNFSPTG